VVDVKPWSPLRGAQDTLPRRDDGAGVIVVMSEGRNADAQLE
jgi:hypothetical protein